VAVNHHLRLGNRDLGAGYSFICVSLFNSSIFVMIKVPNFGYAGNMLLAANISNMATIVTCYMYFWNVSEYVEMVYERLHVICYLRC
jgi:hypothetical protein